MSDIRNVHKYIIGYFYEHKVVHRPLNPNFPNKVIWETRWSLFTPKGKS